MSAGKLPEGWVITTFTELLDVQGGTQPPKSEFISEMQDGYVRLLQIRDFGNKPVPTYIPDTSKLKKCKEEDLLIGRYGASLGRICTGHAGAYNVALAKVIIPKQLERSFVRYYLESEIFQFPLRLLSRSAQNGFNKDDLSKFNFVLVPLSEQKIIAEKLDTLLAQVDSTKARLEQIPQILKRFRQAVLAAAVTGRLTKENKDFITKKVELDNYKILIPEDWNETILNNIINTQRPLCYGVVQPGDDIKDGIELIRVCDINDGEVDLNHLRKISKEIDLQYKRSKVRKNDILVTIVGAIGRIGIVREDINVNIARAVARISPECNIIVPMFLHIWLSSPVMQTWLVQSSKEVARKTLNLKDLKNAFVPLPSIEEQAEIVRRVEQLFAYADTIEKQVNNALARVNNLTQSILAKAFRGELTAQWRAENPELISGENSAAALLEKIKAERAASGGKKASRKKS
ncbi:restriction endonuclease subunit S [Escherichia fergusonii]|uniref:restriction endonuclease subunit S n=1 Tax=Escherichia fergusonii TaxID=564 RepID=UPI0017BC8DAC|nr:restriction endonuclease subunit S [Escherichia fergusonii]EFL4478406.1 restriction endonuclease subunit S [Escherichia fergusonii]MCH5364857.1 restriction endonuclease subunit S [Escherichia fergusonii]HCO5015552.1 restriction endonuclease subunit S [Escherichia fergusonii]